MADEPEKAKEDNKDTKAKKDGGVMTLVIAAVILTLIAAGGGWFLGAKIGKDVIPASDAVKAEQAEPHADKANVPEGVASIITADTHVTSLAPILTNLAAPSSTWIRMEIALVAPTGQALTPGLVSDISNDFLSFLHASTIAQIKGSSGLMNLREDLLDRARIRSAGAVTNVLISSMVIEQ